jgi:hypothetical protein
MNMHHLNQNMNLEYLLQITHNSHPLYHLITILLTNQNRIH